MRYFLEIAYLGKDFVGWQFQNNGISVQQVVEQAIERILSVQVPIIGSGRTDTGVHAKCQVAHFEVSRELPPNFVYSLNAVLPATVAIRDCYQVKDDAHARFSAQSRTYLYCISRAKDPFNSLTSWQFTGKLDLELMQQAAETLLTIDNFTAASKYKPHQINHDCRVTEAQWWQSDDKFFFQISADRFLWRMVRILVGAMVDVGRGELKISDFQQILLSKQRGLLDNAAPAQGLFLSKVSYEPEIKIKKNLLS